MICFPENRCVSIHSLKLHPLYLIGLTAVEREGGRETGRSGADSEQRVYTAGEGFLGSRVMAIGGERVLLPDSQYGLSSHISSENKSLVFVKLTDSSFKAIEEYLRIKVRD